MSLCSRRWRASRREPIPCSVAWRFTWTKKSSSSSATSATTPRPTMASGWRPAKITTKAFVATFRACARSPSLERKLPAGRSSPRALRTLRAPPSAPANSSRRTIPASARSPQKSGPRRRGRGPRRADSVLLLEAFAHAEHVAVGMAEVHLAHIPGLVRGRHGDLEPGGNAELVHFLHIFDPYRHPHALIGRFVAVLRERSCIGAFAPSTLRSLTQKNAHFARTDGAETRRRTPVPEFFPAPLLKQGKSGGYVANIQDRSYAFRDHGNSTGQS